MGERTILEVTVPNQSLDQVRQFLYGWFQSQGYNIEDWQATGEPKVIWKGAVRVKITPVPGAIVATNIGMGGAIVFDILLTQAGPNVQFHIQGYAATAGITSGGEMSLGPNPGLSGRIPRKKGHEAMMRLFNDLGATCGVMLQPTPPGHPMQTMPPHPPYQQQPPQQPYPSQPPQQQTPQQQPHPPGPQQQYQHQPPQQQPPQQQPHPPGPQQQYQHQPPQQQAPPQSQQRPGRTGDAGYRPKFCIHCGGPLEAEAKFCGRCGKTLE